MAKSPDAFRTISEVSEWLDTPAHVLRFWESKFTQVKPVKRAGGRRYYRPEDMALLGGIKTLLHEQGMTIKGVQKLLREQGIRHVAGIGPQPLDGAGSFGTADPSVDPTPAETTQTKTPKPPSGSLTVRLRPGVQVPPDIKIAPTPDLAPKDGLITLLLSIDAVKLRARRAKVVPLVHRLSVLRERMARSVA
jgi:DNA-binding transcriptional MerR regulator